MVAAAAASTAVPNQEESEIAATADHLSGTPASSSTPFGVSGDLTARYGEGGFKTAGSAYFEAT